jgi:hypothetical protein
MADALQDYERPDARPTFITVLCILTFIGSGWGLISESIRYFNANSQAEVISKVKEQTNADLSKNRDTTKADSKFAEMMVKGLNMSPENIRKGALANGVAAILCLAGAFLMWSLKRTGFYLYVAGTLVGITSPFLIFGTDNFLAIISSVVIGFIGLIFVILYGVNLKYMK